MQVFYISLFKIMYYYPITIKNQAGKKSKNRMARKLKYYPSLAMAYTFHFLRLSNQHSSNYLTYAYRITGQGTNLFLDPKTSLVAK